MNLSSLTRIYFSIFFLIGLCAYHSVWAQSDSLSTNQLDEVTVNAFESRRNRLESTATVGIIGPRTLERFPATTFTNAVNTIPGVRMEERSPGSYRFSIRGSLLRSPFGVRNVKFYWNGIPFTDASGNTPLNSMDYSSVGRMEIVKGPGSSLYGAGTGGVVLLSTGSDANNHAEQSFGVGRYGFLSRNTELSLKEVTVRYGHQQQEGYRQQSSMVRDVLQVNSTSRLGQNSTLSLIGMYSDLHYQTPGGINLDQYKKDPTLARQPTPTLPGSVTQNAGIYTRFSYWGVQHGLRLSSNWDQSVSVYLTTNDFANPFISNYEVRDEQGIGGRNVWNYRRTRGSVDLHWTNGFEWQYGKSAQRNFNNNKGQPAGFQASEDIRSRNLSVFSQVELGLPKGFIASAGASGNSFKYGYKRYFPLPFSEQTRQFDLIVSPRVALNKVFLQNWSLTASLSSGYSPPTLQEVRPSAGGFRADLSPERGLNQEISLRHSANRWNLEVNAYRFFLNETIVRRSDNSGAEYFVNAGKTNQRGVEWRIEYDLLRSAGPVQTLKLWNAASLTSYKYLSYQQGATDFSSKTLPGVPPFLQNTGLDLLLKGGIAAFVTYQYSDKVFLNDANTVEAPSFHQLLVRISWKKDWGRHLYSELSASSDWVTADIYSLGYDLNAFGNRYYNGAPTQNRWAGIKAGWKW